ncbi:hypothetical protein [Candidatus Solirubrobacter pratensis]|uniref:hypothetical protein n=1 Tax=Candidatus Solirubrobacter pratensis TaxID=1298857 RepID=UPI0004169131|nr:hypothetical protein [Candidatus Solirubrobacter pratensis]
MADFLDEKQKEIQARLKELEPLVEEYRRLKQAEEALAGVVSGGRNSSPAPAAGARRAGRRAASPRRSGGGTGRRGRPRGSGTRATQALDLVKDRPGITIPEMAEAMGIQQNYLYRVLPSLAEEGKVVKSGRGWHLREGAAS